MRRWPVVLSALALCTSAATVVAGSASADNDNDPYTLSDGHAQAGLMGGVVHAKDARPGGGGPKQSPNLVAHGGPVRSTATSVVPIYWGPGWTTQNGLDKISWLATFYSGLSGSAYMNSNTEYTNSAGGHVTNVVTYSGTVLKDTSAAPTRAPSTSTILNEVAKLVPHPDANTYYPVYIDNGRGSAGYCAWHSYGTANGASFQFAFFFNLNGDNGCDPQDTTGKPLGVAALANVSGHELSEMVTDPQLNAWYDSQGNENSDKCAWTFSGTVQLGSTPWKIQGNWSNKAYNNHQSGYANGGCVESYTTTQ